MPAAPTAPAAPAPKSETAKAKEAPPATVTAPATAPEPPKPAPTAADIEASVRVSLEKVRKAHRDARAAAVRVYRALGLRLSDGTELSVAEAEALAEAMRVLSIDAERLAADVRGVAAHRLQTRHAEESRERSARLQSRVKEWQSDLDALEARKREILTERVQYNSALTSEGAHQNEADRLASAHFLLLAAEEVAIAKMCDPPAPHKIIRSNSEVPQVPAVIPTWG